MPSTFPLIRVVGAAMRRHWDGEFMVRNGLTFLGSGLLLLLVLWLSAGCSVFPAGNSEELQGRVLLWHDWLPEEAAVLNSLVDRFSDLHPGVEVISIPVATDELYATYADRSAAGLGPDLMLIDAGLVYRLAQSGLLRDLADRTDIDRSLFLSSALSSVSTDTELFALPFALHTTVLLYNRTLVQEPPADLDALIAQVSGGVPFGLPTGFVDAFWGVGAYNGVAFDEHGRLALAQGGFVNWLDFLHTAQSIPGFMLDADMNDLARRFLAGELPYLVTDSRNIPRLRDGLTEMFGEDALGVALLPSGPGGGAGTPVLNVDAFAFSRATDQDELNLAMEFARFMVSNQQQIQLATEAVGRIPANAQVRLSQSVPEATAVLARQSRTARSIPFFIRPIWNALHANEFEFLDGYRQVLAGNMSASRFARRMVDAIGEAYDIPVARTDAAELCPLQPTTVTMWHTLARDEAHALEIIAERFGETCPGTRIVPERRDPDSAFDEFVDAAQLGGGPDIFFEASRWLPQLAEQGLLRDLTEYVPPRSLQQFIPRAAETMRYRNRLYGIPESVAVLALFINTTENQDAPLDLDELLVQVTSEERLALPATFFFGYWGMESFGDFTVDAENRLVTDASGLSPWLDWLQQAQTSRGVDLYLDFDEAEDAFAYEEASFFVSGPWSLPRLREEVGETRFSVVPLPDGPEGPGSPILQVQGVMVNAGADDLAVEAAVAFAQFMNLPDSQNLLLATGNHVSASVNVNLEGYPLIAGFRDQARVAQSVVENSYFAMVEEAGDRLYRAVIVNGADPDVAVDRFLADVNADETGATGESGDTPGP